MTRDRKEYERRYLEAVDVEESYRIAKSMEMYRTNPKLGYRTAGSRAEFETGELICREMRRIGLEEIHKDRICLDSWEFERAVLRFTDQKGRQHEFQLGAYQTEFHTGGFREFPLVYAGRGGAQDYVDRDVKGCLVLVDINQRDEWWINFPVYQAHLKGAAAVIAVQDNGYGQVDSAALNAQDIAGPKEAPAFSISMKDASCIKEALRSQERISVWFDAESAVREKVPSYNIWGTIPGKQRNGEHVRGDGSMILLSAHYDSYFSGFQDDNSAVAMMLGIASAILKSGYRPEKTLVFCAMAAEEWGIVNSKYDWSTGAWQQVFRIRPEWRGKVIVNLNFELPAYAHAKWDGIRSVYEYEEFLKEFIEGLPLDIKKIYPEGLMVQSPVETWSDDFSMAISGIPSMVNEFSGAEFMETHYHSQFDTDRFYDQEVYRFHHELYGFLLMAFDQVRVAPLDLRRPLEALRGSIRPVTGREEPESIGELVKRLDEGERLAGELYGIVRSINAEDSYEGDCHGRDLYPETWLRTSRTTEELQQQLLHLFKKEQDYFVRLNWHDEVLFPHEAAQDNLRHLGMAIRCLEESDIPGALESLYRIDNNQYAFQFDRQVFTYFTEYVMRQEKDRLQWGAGRIVHHVSLFDQVHSLKEKWRAGGGDVEEELQTLKQVQDQELACYNDDIQYMIQAMDVLIDGMKKAKEV